MKRMALIFSILFALTCHADEWVNIKGKDYRLTKIDTTQNIVIADGFYDVKMTANDTTITYLGGFGQYFNYEKDVNIPALMLERLKIKTYGIKEEL